ncbi:hypothetical protein SEA_TORTELLINI_72 [Mycobacterium phage Tortellini]|uniref:Uncharacterized protein n=1 Tax=Mycobacterium phage Tortellini TaxID=1897497 RepID=A0A1D8EX81_9CAUD|nr:hypothetical protein FDH05_gp72 [Mycobacterium phage Tortellini]AOT25817.1 hypothetical protein SEA_TORTELLINI_72 [Mycobacterium phage Tortellini]
MRKRFALALIKLAHKVYPPKVIETTEGMSAAAQAGIEVANRAITFASNAAHDYVSGYPGIPLAHAARIAAAEMRADKARRDLARAEAASAAELGVEMHVRIDE